MNKTSGFIRQYDQWTVSFFFFFKVYSDWSFVRRNMSTKETFKKVQYEEKHIDNEEYEYATIPPDGGYGWIVALAAMVFSFLLLLILCLLI